MSGNLSIFLRSRRFEISLFIVSVGLLAASCEDGTRQAKRKEAPLSPLGDMQIQDDEAFPLDSSDPVNWGGEFPKEDERVVLGHVNDTFHGDSEEVLRLQKFLSSNGLSVSRDQSQAGILQLDITWKEFSRARKLIAENEKMFPSFMKFQKAFKRE